MCGASGMRRVLTVDTNNLSHVCGGKIEVGVLCVVESCSKGCRVIEGWGYWEEGRNMVQGTGGSSLSTSRVGG